MRALQTRCLSFLYEPAVGPPSASHGDPVTLHPDYALDPDAVGLGTTGQLDVARVVTHHLPLGGAVRAYDTFAPANPTAAQRVALTRDACVLAPRCVALRSLTLPADTKETRVPL